MFGVDFLLLFVLVLEFADRLPRLWPCDGLRLQVPNLSSGEVDIAPWCIGPFDPCRHRVLDVLWPISAKTEVKSIEGPWSHRVENSRHCLRCDLGTMITSFAVHANDVRLIHGVDPEHCILHNRAETCLAHDRTNSHIIPGAHLGLA